VFVFLFLQSSAVPRQPQSDSANQFVQLVNERRKAERAGDATAWKRLVAADCVWIEPNGRKESAGYHVPHPTVGSSVIHNEVKLSDFDVRQHGDGAVVTYREDVTSMVGSNKIQTAVRLTEVFHPADGRWVLVQSTETPIVERTGIQLDPALFQDYLGDYEVAPNIIGTVYREGDELLLTSKGWRRPYELVPISDTTFFVRGFESTEIVFVRDANGKVIHHISRSPSQEPIVAKKIR
jgi:ketosteroid isomerase-like protein